MKPPLQPPPLQVLIQDLARDPGRLERVLTTCRQPLPAGRYLHWDRLRHRTPPAGLTPEEWWCGVKLARQPLLRELPLRDTAGRPFVFMVPETVQEMLHHIDSRAAGRIALPDQVATPEIRNRFVFSSLVEEAITSSQLEGASTTRQVAAEMIRRQKRPRDRSEQMILNNYRAMEAVRKLADRPLSEDALLELHWTLTWQTLDDPDAAGRMQRHGERRVDVVDHSSGRVLHVPPPAKSLPGRLRKMLQFANDRATGAAFIHPVIRAIILHFWLAYEHPFEDGNGRTARALFYWAMLNQGYWLFEFVSISSVIRKAPARYTRAFLETETDDNDLTYFIVHQLDVIKRALNELERYLERKAAQVREVEKLLRQTRLNHRQLALLSHAIRHPGFTYTIRSHRTSHCVAYATARADLLELSDLGLLEQSRKGKKTWEFTAPADLARRIRKL